MIRKMQFAAATAAGLFLVLADSAWSVPIATDLPYAQYGHNQNDGGRCAATSMINSFEFLRNRYPAIYGGTQIATGTPGGSSPIVELDDMMGGNGCGVTREEAWEGKNQWINTHAPGTTTVHGMTDEDFSTWDNNGGLIAGFPVADWLQDQLTQGQDVEIRIAGPFHWVTLTGITIESDTGQASGIRYIDPNCVNGQSNVTPGPQSVAITIDGDGYMHFGWQNGDGQVCSGATIDAKITTAFAESPIPEPATLVIFGSTLALIGIVRRRRVLH